MKKSGGKMNQFDKSIKIKIELGNTESIRSGLQEYQLLLQNKKAFVNGQLIILKVMQIMKLLKI